MKYYTFYRENNNFDDIENDIIIKKIASTKVRWFQYFMIGIYDYGDANSQNFSLITLKYGDDMIHSLTKDYTPVPGVDYVPKKDKSTFSTVIE